MKKGRFLLIHGVRGFRSRELGSVVHDLICPACPKVSTEIETIPYYAYRLLSTDLALV